MSETDIFVFGSNLAGIHGRGSAWEARKHHGALQNVGVGRMGQAYAIPTKDKWLRTLTLPTIEAYVKTFIEYTRSNPDLTFNVVAIGCGLAGYSPDEIAPMFKEAPINVKLPESFNRVLAEDRQLTLFKQIRD